MIAGVVMHRRIVTRQRPAFAASRAFGDKRKGEGMWLVYLRFDDQGVVRTYHIRTGSRADVDVILALAKQRLLAA